MDGHTYINRCSFEIAACYARLQGQRLSLSHAGSCDLLTTSGSVNANPYYVTNSRQCDEICDEEGDRSLICGSDGKTYDNLCAFMNAQCNATKHHHSLTLIFHGACPDIHTSCDDVVHLRCPTENDLVCGTDGLTYMNECYLRQSECRYISLSTTHQVNLQHHGSCQDNSTAESRNIDCRKYQVSGAIAVEGGLTNLQIQCLTHQESGLLCGTDGVTYRNECIYCEQLQRQNRLGSDSMTAIVAHDGFCRHFSIIG
ncbi:hypothetical protein CHS0354_033237 [Potamilus streckersoni]|uniref:Kazal-like domain-containing protein n=1 Tax=Potamilus streckersoni TaxID=2493646 RepID=A0AAE0S6C2_9BIVA|nr:hypothetical protein CHS0354_033237 [Potamilus streckersoni]